MIISFSALITNYNTWELTTFCTQELDHWSKDSLTEILVVDDASEQKAPDKNLPDKVRVIYNSENRGYVTSVNIGFSHLQEDVILLLDSDAYPLMDLTQPLAKLFASNPQLGVVGFKLVDEQGQPTGAYSREPNALELLLGQRLSAVYNTKFKHRIEAPPCLHSCGIAVRRIAFEEIGGFDEGFDFLDADLDFSMRLRAAGWHVQVDPNLVAYHKGGGSYQTTAKRVLRHQRNRWRLLAKHGHLPQPWLLKAGLLTRYVLEYGFLRIAGKLVIKDPETLEDKLYGRQQLLKEVIML
ncbi:glycosyltransferase family 2 protein [Calothrix sp. PCC 7507]|uniref:glycosyltransferase family 2 protein n=1 Tax=Calothrix sp. PCC 7507 TaxID=99598 RepID=UPI00029F2737|nr:glycosyltransferase family 2 protein [Calothrix sp. PCC 7507]AFY30862.1 glycosyl transferase family 2 [Calothrix sp. PCC 7507]